jgi:Icc-related predicted phosphoesterase
MVKNIEGKLVQISNPQSLTVVGDLHGDLESFEKILANRKKEENNYIIFLGDYADRGEKGVEIIEKLIELKNNENVVLLKGNHEDYDSRGDPKFSPCTLIDEVQCKRGFWRSYFSKKLEPFFDGLYLAAIADKILFVHGGISSSIKSLDDLKHPELSGEDILWSDPDKTGRKGEYCNRRGAGVEFGEDVTEKVLNNIGVSLLVRSHQPRLASNGPNLTQKKVVTISSTNVYGGMPHYLEIPGSKIGEITSSPIEIKKYTKFL